MAALKSGKFWAGVVIGLVLCYLYQNHMKGKLGG